VTLVAKSRLLFWLVFLIAVAACDVGTGLSTGVAKISLAIAPEMRTATPVPPPFVSTIDSVNVVIRSPDGTRTVLGSPIHNSEKSVPFDVTLDRGNTQFSVSVLAKSGATLFRADTTVFVNDDPFDVQIGVHAVLPVLVIAPDTITITVTDPKNANAQATLYNRGLDSLTWQLKSVPAVYSTCPQQCAAFPNSGELGAGDSQTLTFFVPVGFPPQTLCYVYSSKDGDVTLCWRKS